MEILAFPAARLPLQLRVKLWGYFAFSVSQLQQMRTFLYAAMSFLAFILRIKLVINHPQPIIVFFQFLNRPWQELSNSIVLITTLTPQKPEILHTALHSLPPVSHSSSPPVTTALQLHARCYQYSIYHQWVGLHSQSPDRWSSFKIPFWNHLPRTVPGTNCHRLGSLETDSNMNIFTEEIYWSAVPGTIPVQEQEK